MPWLIVVLGLGLVGAGGAAVVHGSPYLQLEFGWTEVIAGTVALSSGVVTLALAAVLASLGALRRAVERGGRPAPVPPQEALPPAPVVAGAPLVPAETAPPSVAGRYESGGSSYVLYSDGTIEVEGRTGRHRFGSMEDLRAFMASERPEPVPSAR